MERAPARVLIVDDDDDIRANFNDILNDLGYHTDTAHDGPSAVEMVEAQAYDVVLLDYKMPGMDGARLYRKIKAIRPEAAAIMITAYAGGTGAQEAMDAGTWRVLRKPVDVGQLLSLLDEASRAPVVLVVDDDLDFCQSLWQLLSEQHYRVALAHSEDEGIRKAKEGDYQYALIDLRLGSGDGRKVVDRILEANPTAKTILVTGHRDDAEQVLQDCHEHGIDCVCYKPIEMDQLMSAIGATET